MTPKIIQHFFEKNGQIMEKAILDLQAEFFTQTL